MIQSADYLYGYSNGIMHNPLSFYYYFYLHNTVSGEPLNKGQVEASHFVLSRPLQRLKMYYKPVYWKMNMWDIEECPVKRLFSFLLCPLL